MNKKTPNKGDDSYSSKRYVYRGMLVNLYREIEKTNSLNILRKINELIPERNFHDYTHILYDLRTLLGNEKKVYLEIGSYVGSSSSLMLQHIYPTDIICIDPLILHEDHYNGNLNQEDTLNKNLNNNNIHDYEITIHKNYSDDKSLLNRLGDLKVDILFIDGCHKYQSVINDFINYKDRLNEGGFIVFDDYLDSEHSPEVKEAVDFIIKNFNLDEYEIIGSIPDYKNICDQENSNEFLLYKKP